MIVEYRYFLTLAGNEREVTPAEYLVVQREAGVENQSAISFRLGAVQGRVRAEIKE